MGVYEVVYEEYKEDGKIKEIYEYVEAPDLLSVAKLSHNFAKMYDYGLIRVRYVLNVVRTIEKENEKDEMV